jgi:hypothetical protein
LRPSHVPAHSSRLAGAAGALLLQGGFLLMFLSSMPAFRPPPVIGRELSLILPRFRPASPLVRRPQDTPSLVTVTPPLFLAPNMPSNALTRPVLPAAPGIATFGQALNNCAPEKYSSLPPDQQARCPHPGAGVAIQEFPNLMGTPSDVKDEARWQAEWARETSPLWLPCTGTIGFIDFICLARTIANGSLTDPRSWPIYEIKQLPPDDFYKIEQAYDAWNKEHPDSAPENARAAR